MQLKSTTIVLWIIASVGLLLTLLPSLLVFAGAIPMERHLTLMAIGMILWFGGRITIQYLNSRP